MEARDATYQLWGRGFADPDQFAADIGSGAVIAEAIGIVKGTLVQGGRSYDSGWHCGHDMSCIITGSAHLNPDGSACSRACGINCTTFGSTVTCNGVPSSALEAHEYQHVLDIRSLGGFGFYGSYGVDWLQQLRACGWDCNPHDQLALEERGIAAYNSYVANEAYIQSLPGGP